MTTLDEDWVCDEDDLSAESQCFAIWQVCEDCCGFHPKPEISGGFVPKGKGLPLAEQEGNMWYERADEFSEWDICPTCTGSGGGYCCGFHDLGESDPMTGARN